MSKRARQEGTEAFPRGGGAARPAATAAEERDIPDVFGQRQGKKAKKTKRSVFEDEVGAPFPTGRGKPCAPFP